MDSKVHDLMYLLPDCIIIIATFLGSYPGGACMGTLQKLRLVVFNHRVVTWLQTNWRDSGFVRFILVW